MTRKIVVIHGSPRHHSFSSYYAKFFTEHLSPLVADTEHFYLRRLTFSGCTACDACQKGFDHCIIKDDLIPLLEAVRACELVIIASPIYFDSLSSLVQAFLERCQSFYTTNFLQRPDKSRLVAGKKLVLITAQEQKFGHRYQELTSRMSFHFSHFGFSPPLFLAIDQIHPTDNPASKELFLKKLKLAADELFY